MIATESIVPRKKLKIKIIKKTLEAGLGRRSCDLGQQVPLGDDQSTDKASVDCARKRGPQGVLENQKVKKQKMDRSMTLQCSIILKKLMSHKAGWVFNQPVDPVVLNIPDYFTIISKPMDLGTIKSKLEKDMYSDIEEFASDVKLTFSNAMLYNPPANLVHKMAKQLNQIFEMRWKTVSEKCNMECSMVRPGISSSGQLKKTIDTRHDFHKKHGDITMYSLKSVCNAEVLKVILSNIMALLLPINLVTLLLQVCVINATDLTASVAFLVIQLMHQVDFKAITTPGINFKAKVKLTSQPAKSDPDSDVSTLDDENLCPSSQLMIPVTGWNTPTFDVPLSPKRALRAAMLKSRFADTILKAQQKTLLDHGERSDFVKMQKEKQRLERTQREVSNLTEKARIEAQIKAAEDASTMREKIELKQQREKERRAARVALEQIEKTVEIDQNLEALKELEILSGHDKSFGTATGAPSLLAKLGLFMKDEYEDNDDDGDAVFREEGEIL